MTIEEENRLDELEDKNSNRTGPQLTEKETEELQFLLDKKYNQDIK